ncbi:MAG: 50S ribosomal protein L24 [Nitriliruptorales bacterium]
MQRVRKDDQVLVVSGKDRGREGRVIRVWPHEDRVLIEGVNVVTKHERIRQTRRGAQEGGIIQTELPVHVSNVQPICPSCGEATRVGYREEEEGDRRSKARVCRRCDATF